MDEETKQTIVDFMYAICLCLSIYIIVRGCHIDYWWGETILGAVSIISLGMIGSHFEEKEKNGNKNLLRVEG